MSFTGGFMNYVNLLDLAHSFWQKHLTASDNAIDATCGNGHDTLFLTQLLTSGSLFAFDIQEQALINTKKLLKEHGIENTKSSKNTKIIKSRCSKKQKLCFFQQSHTTFKKTLFNCPIKLIVYNLGYLPGSDKKLTTLTQNTLISLEKALDLIIPGGALSIICYPGHTEGKKETAAVEIWVENLKKQTSYKVKVSRFKGSKSADAPSFFWVQKTNSSIHH